MLIYLVLAVLASTLMALGLLMMKSRAESLPDARGSRIIGGVLAWLHDPMWAGGMTVQVAGWVMYVTAVSQAPVSMFSNRSRRLQGIRCSSFPMSSWPRTSPA